MTQEAREFGISASRIIFLDAIKTPLAPMIGITATSTYISLGAYAVVSP
jgi:hypothetical protein